MCSFSEKKTVGPSDIVITFVGIELDSIKFQARPPKDKLLKAKDSVKFWISIRSATKRNLLSPIGYLHHCCQVIVPARPFLHPLIVLFITVAGLNCRFHYRERLSVI